jgi:Epoxide hydrolase N terminus
MHTTRAFEVNWSEADVARVLDRVAATRLPAAPPGSGWAYGCDAAYLQGFQRYWAERYDWRAAVAQLNKWPQFIARIDGQDVHYLHVRGEAKTPRTCR